MDRSISVRYAWGNMLVKTFHFCLFWEWHTIIGISRMKPIFDMEIRTFRNDVFRKIPHHHHHHHQKVILSHRVSKDKRTLATQGNDFLKHRPEQQCWYIAVAAIGYRGQREWFNWHFKRTRALKLYGIRACVSKTYCHITKYKKVSVVRIIFVSGKSSSFRHIGAKRLYN